MRPSDPAETEPAAGGPGAGSAASALPPWHWQPSTDPGAGGYGPPWGGGSTWGRRWGRGRRRVPGVRLALFIGLIQVIGTTFAAHHDQSAARPLSWVGYALVIGGPLALSFRRRYWSVALVGAVASALAYYALSFPGGPYFLAAFVAMASAILAGHRRTTWVVAGLAYAFVVGFGWLVPSIGGVPVNQPGIGGAIAIAAWTLVTLAVAEATRNRASALAEIARTRAEQARTRQEQARTRSEQQRRQSSEERLRIAQELHDVVGHHLSLINVQAGVGLHLMDERPEQARVSLQTIKAASSEALAEVRAVLGLLRAEEGEAAPRAPAPSLANLSVLLDTAQARLVTSGEPRSLPPEVDRAAYRIVREALTNVRRHAGEAARATVAIGYLPDALTVEITDDGVGVTAVPEEGNGLAGMRARAQALGGSLVAGPAAGGGFRVSARLPHRAGTADPVHSTDPAAEEAM